MKRLPDCNGRNNSTHTHTGATTCLARVPKRAHLGAAIVVVQQLDGVAPHAVHLIAKAALLVDLRWGMGQKGTQHHIERRESTFTLAAGRMGQHTARKVRPAIGCWCTSLLPVLSCPPWGWVGGVGVGVGVVVQMIKATACLSRRVPTCS